MLALRGVRLAPDSQEFDHDFHADGITVVLGGNDSGKTNLCRLIAGLPTDCAQGEVSLDGESLAATPLRKRPVALVYQAFVNYPNLTVAQNIASPMRTADPDRVAALAEKLKISELLNRLPSELSGGQQQRVAIARALAKQARVLLLDEPLVNLDFKLREALQTELRGLLQDSDTIVIYTCCDRRDAFALADEILLLDNGGKVQSGAPLELYRQPNSLTSMHLLSDARINTWQAPDQSGTAVSAVRPEHLKILSDGERSDLEFQFRVEEMETDGASTLLFGRCKDDLWVVKQPGLVNISVGAELRLGTQISDVVAFSG